MTNIENAVRSDESAAAILTRAPAVVSDLYEHYHKLATASAAFSRAMNQRLTEIGDDERKLDAAHQMALRDYARAAKGMPDEQLQKYQREKLAFKNRRDKANADARRTSFFTQLDDLDLLIKRIDPTTMRVVDLPTPEFEDLQAQLDTATSAVEVAKKELAAEESLPRNYDFALASITADLDRLERIGAPDLSGLCNVKDFDRRGRFEIDETLGVIGWPVAYFEMGKDLKTFDAKAFHVWLNRAAIEKKLLAAIEPLRDKGVSVEEKLARVAAAQDKLADALRIENSIVVAMEQSGNFSVRRRAYSPFILLQLDAPPKVIVEYSA